MSLSGGNNLFQNRMKLSIINFSSRSRINSSFVHQSILKENYKIYITHTWIKSDFESKTLVITSKSFTKLVGPLIIRNIYLYINNYLEQMVHFSKLEGTDN